MLNVRIFPKRLLRPRYLCCFLDEDDSTLYCCSSERMSSNSTTSTARTICSAKTRSLITSLLQLLHFHVTILSTSFFSASDLEALSSYDGFDDATCLTNALGRWITCHADSFALDEIWHDFQIFVRAAFGPPSCLEFGTEY